MRRAASCAALSRLWQGCLSDCSALSSCGVGGGVFRCFYFEKRRPDVIPQRRRRNQQGSLFAYIKQDETTTHSEKRRRGRSRKSRQRPVASSSSSTEGAGGGGAPFGVVEKRIQSTSDETFIQDALLKRMLGKEGAANVSKFSRKKNVVSVQKKDVEDVGEASSIFKTGSVPAIRSRAHNEQARKRTVKRRQEVRLHAKHSSGVHPCLVQTPDRCCPNEELCPFTQVAEDVCLQQLRHGRCRQHEEGRCPWKHEMGLGSKKEDGIADEVDIELVSLGAKELLLTFDDALASYDAQDSDSLLIRCDAAPRRSVTSSGDGGEERRAAGASDRWMLHRSVAICAVLPLVEEEVETATDPGVDAVPVAIMRDATRRAEWLLEGILKTYSCLFGSAEVSEGICVSLSLEASEYLAKRKSLLNAQDSSLSTAAESSLSSQPTLRDAVVYSFLKLQGVIRDQSVEGSNRDESFQTFLRCMQFLAQPSGQRLAHASSLSEEPHDVSALFLCIHPDCCQPSLPLPQPLNVQSASNSMAPLFTSAASVERTFSNHFNFWVEQFECVFNTWLRSTYRTVSMIHCMLEVVRVIGSDLEAFYAHSLRRLSSGQQWGRATGGGDDDDSDSLFNPRNPVQLNVHDYVAQRLVVVRSAFVSWVFNHMYMSCGIAAGLAVRERVLSSWPSYFASLNTTTPLTGEEHEHPRGVDGRDFLLRCRLPEAVKRHAAYSTSLDTLLAAIKIEGVRLEESRNTLTEEYRSRHAAWSAARQKKDQTINRDQNQQRLSDRHASLMTRRVDEAPQHPLDRLLPRGCVATSPVVTRMMLRSLYVRGKLFRCLKYSMAFVRTAQLLKKASVMPLPELVVREKTVMRSVRDRNTGKQRVIRRRVDVVRRELPPDAVALSRSTVGQPSLSLYFAIDEGVCCEMLSIIGAFGPSKWKLKLVIWNEVRAGALANFGASAGSGSIAHCLPTPAMKKNNNNTPAAAAATVLSFIKRLHNHHNNDDAPATGRRIFANGECIEILLQQTWIRQQQQQQQEGWSSSSSNDPSNRTNNSTTTDALTTTTVATSQFLKQLGSFIAADPSHRLDMHAALQFMFTVSRVDIVLGYFLLFPQEMPWFTSAWDRRGSSPLLSTAPNVKSWLMNQQSREEDDRHDHDGNEGGDERDEANTESLMHQKQRRYEDLSRGLQRLSQILALPITHHHHEHHRLTSSIVQNRSAACVFAAGCGFLAGLTENNVAHLQHHLTHHGEGGGEGLSLLTALLEGVSSDSDADTLLMSLLSSGLLTTFSTTVAVRRGVRSQARPVSAASLRDPSGEGSVVVDAMLYPSGIVFISVERACSVLEYLSVLLLKTDEERRHLPVKAAMDALEADLGPFLRYILAPLRILCTTTTTTTSNSNNNQRLQLVGKRQSAQHLSTGLVHVIHGERWKQRLLMMCRESSDGRNPEGAEDVRKLECWFERMRSQYPFLSSS